MHEKKLYFCRKLLLTNLSASYFGAELFFLSQNLQIATAFFYICLICALCAKHKKGAGVYLAPALRFVRNSRRQGWHNTPYTPCALPYLMLKHPCEQLLV